jgi:hypothetical protein
MAEKSRATQGLADFSNAGVEDGACDHGGDLVWTLLSVTRVPKPFGNGSDD